MTHEAVLLTLNLILWGFFAYRFAFAVRDRKVTNGVSLRAWGVVFCLYLIAASTVPSLESLIDARLGGIPITNLVRSVMILITTQFIMLIVRPEVTRLVLMRVFLWTNPLFTCGLILIFAAFVRSGLPYGANYALIKLIRDTIMIGWMLVLVLPTFNHLWGLERVRPMKLRYGIGTVLGVVYVIQCASSIGVVIATGSPLERALLLTANTASSVCIGLFIAILIPYRWLMPVFYPRQRRLYQRLEQLEARVKLWATEPPLLPNLPLNLTNPDELELAIYQKVISILDLSVTMRPGGAALQARIEAVVDLSIPFSELAEKLAALR